MVLICKYGKSLAKLICANNDMEGQHKTQALSRIIGEK
jgi:hypothetical protein